MTVQDTGKGLLYREDMDKVRSRLTTWWQGGDIGRPVIQITAPRAEPLETFPEMVEPEGWTGPYSTANYDYRVYLAKTTHRDITYLGECVPSVAPDLAPNCLALYLGCEGRELPGTVWCKPFITDPESFQPEYDPENFYWQFTQRLGSAMQEFCAGKSMIQFPDLIEGLDTLEGMRGGEHLLMDLYDRPEWVHGMLDRITELYFLYYDKLYDMFKDETGGSIFWAWAPGRMAKLQCDFSAMIGPDMFGEFMVPVLEKMTAKFDHCMYHWDGPGAIPHHDHLLGIENLDMLQWVPGAGAADTTSSEWYGLYHKTVESGKKIFVGDGAKDVETVLRLKKEFGEQFKQFLITGHVNSVAEAEEIIKAAEV